MPTRLNAAHANGERKQFFLKKAGIRFTVFAHQLLVLVLHLQPGGDAVPGVEEGLPLRDLHQVVHEEADKVHRHEQLYRKRKTCVK